MAGLKMIDVDPHQSPWIRSQFAKEIAAATGHSLLCGSSSWRTSSGLLPAAALTPSTEPNPGEASTADQATTLP
ncbi:hypothetical protein [Micromonospora sp. NPDC023814]|uniref:hypothetical protein n=1 Tax=Micromonospora sp. NPDC023814 TaxID=3154596 RepID=UPI0033FE4B49